MTCKKCGAVLQAGARACQNCGAPVNRQPTREEIRARVQGGGRHAAPRKTVSRPAVSVLRAEDNSPADLAPLLCLCAGILGILQIIYLFIKTVFVTLAAGQTDFGVMSYSMYGALRESKLTILGVLLLLLCILIMGSISLPMILRGRPKAALTIGLSALLLLVYVVAIVALRSAFDDNYMGARPKLGFYGWMFILNCLLIPFLLFAAGRSDEALEEQRVAAQPAPRGPAPRPAPAAQPQQARRPASGGSVRPAGPARNVTPPDAETIAALRRMAQMHREGLVSDEEFARIKAECVARGWIRE